DGGHWDPHVYLAQHVPARLVHGVVVARRHDQTTAQAKVCVLPLRHRRPEQQQPDRGATTNEPSHGASGLREMFGPGTRSMIGTSLPKCKRVSGVTGPTTCARAPWMCEKLTEHLRSLPDAGGALLVRRVHRPERIARCPGVHARRPLPL